MAKFANRVKVTVDSSTSGTGAVTLSTAVSGYQAVPSALDGASIRYVIELGTAWEIGLGVYTHSSLNLTRSLTSSSTGSLLNLNNTAVVFISPAAEDLQYVEVYSSTSDLPSASSNHGRIAHVHGDGAMYFAHGGNWVRLGNHSDITSYTLPTASSSTLGGIKIGSGLSIDGSGVVTASGSSGIALTDLSVTQNSASGTGALNYDNTSGVFSYTPPASSGTSSTGSSLIPITTTKTTATAGQTVFTGSWKAANIAVFLNGVKLQDSEVTATDTQITISAAAVGDIVEVVEYGAPFASPYASTFPTVTTGATSVTVNYTVDKVAVYKNGVKLRGGGVDFTATNGTSITGFSAFVSGDVVEVVEHGSLAESGGGVTAYDNYSDLPSSGNTDGDMGWVKDVSGSGATKAMYVWDGAEWDRVYSDSQEGPTFTTSPNSSYALSGGANTDVTVAASDPDGFPITYSVVVNPSNQAQATITQPSTGTFRFAASSNTSNGGSFTAKFVADDGIYRVIASTSFSLTFSIWSSLTNFNTTFSQDSETYQSSMPFEEGDYDPAIGFNADGTKFFSSRGANVYRYNVSPAYSTTLSSRTSVFSGMYSGNNNTSGGPSRFVDGGSKFIYQTAATTVAMVSLTSDYDLSTAGTASSQSLNGVSTIHSMAMSSDGTKLLIGEDRSMKVYSLSSSFDWSSDTFSSVTPVTVDFSSLSSSALSNSSFDAVSIVEGDGLRLFVVFWRNFVAQLIDYTFGTAGDYSTLSETSNGVHSLTLSSGTYGGLRGAFFKEDDGSRLFAKVFRSSGGDKAFFTKWDTGFN